MKAPKFLMAGLLAFSTVVASNAQTVIHLTGSTAFRAATQKALEDILVAGYTESWYGNATVYKCTGSILTGTTVSGSIPVIIKTYWSGSGAGIETVSEGLPIANWMTNNTPAGFQSTTPTTFDPPVAPDACMADVYQASTPFTSPVLNDQIVGIVPFKWVRNNGAPAALANMTPQLATSLFTTTTGSLPLSLFTGLTSDEGTNIYAMGRNADSGTRLTAFAETQVGPFTEVYQYYATNSSGVRLSSTAGVALNVASQGLVPVDTVNGIVYPQGDSGYSSGGDLADAMGATGSAAAIHGFYVTYLGLTDAFTAEGLGAADLTYNGATFSTNAVQEGQYTFWGYEHLDYLSGYSGNGKTVANQIAAKISSADADFIIPGQTVAAGIRTVFMKVSRSTDGGPVSN